MSTSRFVSIWRILSDYTFKIEVDNICENLLCIICKRIMVDACQGACGCHYCYKCINDFLRSGENKFCPGGKVECNEDELVMGRDLTRDRTSNNKIYNLKVHCPNDLCKSRLQLSQMEEHLQQCTNPSITCPYIVMGCDEDIVPKVPILSHLHNESLAHTKLLIEWIKNLKDEMEGLKESAVSTKLEIDTLKEQVQVKDEEIDAIKTELMVVRDDVAMKDSRIRTLESEWTKKEVGCAEDVRCMSENAVSVIEDGKSRDMRIVALERDWRTKDAVLRDIRMQLEYVKEESEMKDERLTELERDSRNNEVKVTDLMQQIINLKKENISVKEESMTIKNAMEIMSRQFSRSEAKSRLGVLKMEGDKRLKRKKEVRLAVKRPRMKIEKLMAAVDMDEDAVLGGITVIVERFSSRKEGERIISGHFYSHRGGYKWQLWVYPRQYGPMLSVCFVVCKGEFDECMEWPCPRSVSLGLVNQISEELEYTVTYNHADMHPHCKYLFKRPRAQDNHPYETRLIGHEQLRSCAGLLINDSVAIRCVISQ